MKTILYQFLLISLSLWACCGWAEGGAVSEKPIARLGKGTVKAIRYSPE